MAIISYNVGSTSASPIFTEPYSSGFKEAILDSIFNGTSLPKNLIRALSGSFRLSLNNYFEYGQDGFYDSLPFCRNYVMAFRYPSATNYVDMDYGFNDYPYPMYPIVALKEDNRYVDEDKTSEKYLSTKEILDTLPIDSDTIFESVKDVPGEVDAIYFGIFANIYSKVPSIKRYLWDFFDDLKSHTRLSEGAFEYFIDKRTKYPRLNSFAIFEGLSNALYYGFMRKSTVNRIIGEIGEVSITVVGRSDRIVYHDLYSQKDGWTTLKIKIPNSYFYLDKQISETQCSRVYIGSTGLYNRVQTESGGYATYYTPIVTDPDAQQQNRFIIPIVPAILNKMSNEDIEEIQYYGLHIQANTGKYVTEIVETSVWDSFVQFVIGVAGAIAANMTGSVTTFSIADIFLKEIFKYLTEIIVDWLVELDILDEKIIAVLLEVASVLVALNFDAGGSGIKGLPWAESLMKASTLFKEKKAEQFQDQLSDLKDEYDEWSAEYATKLEELELKEAALLGSNIADPLKLMNMGQYFNPNETPADFYQRTIHEGNPGVKSLDAIAHFTTGALALPQANSTDDGFVI